MKKNAGNKISGQSFRADSTSASQVPNIAGPSERAEGSELEQEPSPSRQDLIHRLQKAREEAALAPAGPGTLRNSRSDLDQDLAFLREALPQYEIQERVQYGGQGAVYRAVQRTPRRQIAVKVLLDGPLATERQRARFEREAEITSKLRHPNIVTLFDYGMVRQRPYLAMQFVDGLRVGEYAVLNDLDPNGIVRLMASVGRAIHFAHQNGVIHRDLSPANILVDADGVPYVLDFGLAKEILAHHANEGASQMSGIVGTLPYLSPEQLGLTPGPVDVRSDVFSLGVILYELLAESSPFVPQDPELHGLALLTSRRVIPLRAALNQCGNSRWPRGRVGRDLEAIVHHCIAEERSRRYQSAAELADDLECYLAGEAVKARQDSFAYRARKFVRRHRLAASAATAIALTVCVSAILVVQAWFNVRVQRDAAQEAASVAFTLLSQVLDTDDAMRSLAGGVAASDASLKLATQILPKVELLIKDAGAANSVRLRLDERCGDLARILGRKPDAISHYRASVAAAERQIKEHGRDDKSLLMLAQAKRKLASQLDDAAELFTSAISAAEAALALAPSFSAEQLLCALHTDFGDSEMRQQHLGSAAEQLNRARSYVRRDDAEMTEDLDWAETVARMYYIRGRVFAQAGVPTEALADEAECVMVREHMVRLWPTNAAVRHQLMLATLHLAYMRDNIGQNAEARRLYERAVALGRTLHELDPSAYSWTRDFFAATYMLALRSINGEFANSAEGHYLATLELAQEMYKAQPSNEDSILALSRATALGGQLKLRDQDLPGAKSDFMRALVPLDDAPGPVAESRELLRVRAENLDWLGTVARRMGNLEEAREWYEALLCIRSDMVESAPQVIEYHMDLVDAQINQAIALIYLGDDSASRAAAAALLTKATEDLAELSRNGQLGSQEKRFANEQVQLFQARQQLYSKLGAL